MPSRLIVYIERDRVPPPRRIERSLRIHGISLTLDWTDPLLARRGPIHAELDGEEVSFELEVGRRSELDLVDHGDVALTFVGRGELGGVAAGWIARVVASLGGGVLSRPATGELLSATEIRFD